MAKRDDSRRAQALRLGGPLVAPAGGIVGESLAPSPMLATLPITGS